VIGLRHTDEWVGAIVIAAVLLFLAAVLEAGVLHDWFRPVAHLRIVLPQSGVGGLAVGADVEVLGIHAGVVRRIILNPDQQMYADAEIDQQATAFIRRDSKAVIRRRFGVAGAAFVDVSRGTGPSLDWNYAVVEAVTERAPTDTMSGMIDEIRQKIIPILDRVNHSMDALAVIADNVRAGHGTLGRLITDDTLTREAEEAVGTARQEIAALSPMISRLDASARHLDEVMQSLGSAKDGVPELIRRVDALLKNLQSATRDVARASPRLPEIAGNLAGSTADLPGVLTQAQITAAELEQLLTQLRGLWYLGGSNSPPPQTRLPATRIQP
jgi:phospholipid/cholesterol/gamma-HCH transport system substrate-binding protein